MRHTYFILYAQPQPYGPLEHETGTWYLVIMVSASYSAAPSANMAYDYDYADSDSV